jgi:cystathionine beta-synthase
MATAAAVRLAQEVDDPEAVIVVLLPDGGRGYLGKVFDDAWMSRLGFLRPGQEQTVGQVLRGKDGSLPALVHTHPNETIADAVAILREYKVSQLPVVRAEPPIMAAEVAGAVSERALLEGLYTGAAQLADRVEQHMEEQLPTVGAGEPIAIAVNALEEADAVIVHEDGAPVGVLTRVDLLDYIAGA